MRTSRLLAAALLLALVAAACDSGGKGTGTTTTTTTRPASRIEHPTGARDVVVRINTGGGLVPSEYRLGEIPGFTLYGDGRNVVVGPIPELYPPHALPNLLEIRVGEDVVQTILRAARDALLLDGKIDYGQPTIFDAPTTTITVEAGGAKRTVSIYALGIDIGDSPGLSAAQRAARRRVSRFVTRAGAAAVGDQKPYVAAAVAVYVRPYVTRDGTGVTPGTAVWPLGDLAGAGEPVVIEPSYRCLVARGADATTVLAAAAKATTITRWQSAGADYTLVFRPLLPDQSSCAIAA